MKNKVWSGIVAITAGVGIAAATGLAQSPAIAASGPTIVWDYSMQDNIGPFESGTVGPPGNQVDLTGKFVPANKMTSDPDYPVAGNALYGEVPADGLYEVTLNACATQVTGNAVYAWTIDGSFYAGADCQMRVLLPEGTRNYMLKVDDDAGVSQVTGTFVVKDTLVAIMGDSYASGEGYPPFYIGNVNPKTGQPYEYSIVGGSAPYIPDWDEVTCQRSRWSGFVRAAAQLEAADPHSSVTVVNVTCAGAQITSTKDIYGDLFGGEGGMLTPKRPLSPVGPITGAVPSIPSQIDQLNALLKGQSVDVGLLSIGGNDLGLSPLITNCLFAAEYDTSCLDSDDLWSKPAWQVVDDALSQIPGKFKLLQPCLTGGNCQTTKVGDTQPTASQSLQITAPNVLQVGYPNLLRDSNGQYCNRSVEELGTNTSDPNYILGINAPFKTSDAQWADQVLLQGTGQPTSISLWYGTAQSPWVPTDTGPAVDITPTAPGLVTMFVQNSLNYKWTLVPEPYLNSTNGGICADDSTRLLFPVEAALAGVLPEVGGTMNESGVAHPNEMGQELYATSIYPYAVKQAGLPVAAKTQKSVTPTPTPINPPTKVKVKTNKKSCGPRYCHVKIKFKAPTAGMEPTAYKIKTKIKGHTWNTLRQGLKKTHTTWKKAPWKKKKFKMKVAAYAEESGLNGGKVQYINWTKVKTYKIK